MDWIFLDENYQQTENFDDASFIYIYPDKLQDFVRKYNKEFNCDSITEEEAWFIWNYNGYRWEQTTDKSMLTILNQTKEELEGKLKKNSFTDKITTLYKVAVEVEPVGIVYLDCLTSNIEEAVAAISLAADPNIFGKRAKKFTIEVVRE